MTRQRIILLVLAAAIAMVTGCSVHGGAYEALSAAEVGERIQQAADLSGMKRGQAEQLRKLYHIETADVADYVLYTALSNVKADELAIIKVKDTSGTGRVMDQIRQRIEEQTVKFKDYRPEAYYLIEKHVLKSRGPFVIFAVSKDADLMEAAFDKMVK